MAADGAQSSAAGEAQRSVPFHGAVDRPGEGGQSCRCHLAIDEFEVERSVVGDEKFVGREEAPHLRGVNFERVLNGQDPIRKSMNLLRAAIVSLTGIKDQVPIGKVK